VSTAQVERRLAEQGALPLAGQPGTRKARLLYAAVLRVRARGGTGLVGGYARRSGEERFAPLLGALRGDSPAQQRQVLQGRGWLVHLLPELAELQVAAIACLLKLPPGRPGGCWC